MGAACGACQIRRMSVAQPSLVNYRSFRDFTVSFPEMACLVGPNNAGESTVLNAIRLADSMLRVAHARSAPGRAACRGIGYGAYPISLTEFPSLRESLRHEFQNVEARMELTWRSGNRLIAVWSESEEAGDEPSGMFFLRLAGEAQPAGVAGSRQAFPRLGIVRRSGR